MPCGERRSPSSTTSCRGSPRDRRDHAPLPRPLAPRAARRRHRRNPTERPARTAPRRGAALFVAWPASRVARRDPRADALDPRRLAGRGTRALHRRARPSADRARIGRVGVRRHRRGPGHRHLRVHVGARLRRLIEDRRRQARRQRVSGQPQERSRGDRRVQRRGERRKSSSLPSTRARLPEERRSAPDSRRGSTCYATPTRSRRS